MRRLISSLTLTAICLGAVVASGGIKPAPLRAVETFEKQCSSCHGQEGAMFDPGFEKKYASPGDLREMVETMPGVSQMRPEQVDVLLAYVRAISRGEVFLIWTDAKSTVLEGEISPRNASVRAFAKGKTLKVERLASHRWRVPLPSGIRVEDVQVTGHYRGRTSTLVLRQGAYTHSR